MLEHEFQVAGPPAQNRHIFSKDEDMEFLIEAKTRFDVAQTGSSAWRKDIQLYYDAYGNDIWPEGVKEQMEAEGRPAVNPNYATHMVNTVLGQDMADRQEIRFKPVDVTEYDGVVSDWLTRLVRYFYEKCGGHRHETQARFDQLVTGLGWCEVFIDVTRVPFTVKTSHVPCYEMYWDPGAKDDGLTDAEYLFRKREWDKERLVAKWPKAKDLVAQTLGTTIPTPSGSTIQHRKPVPLGTYGKGKESLNTVTVLEYQYKKPESWVAYITEPVMDEMTGEMISEGGEQVTCTRKEFNKRFGATPDSGKPPRPLEWVSFPKDVYYRCYLLDTHNDRMAMLQEPKRIEQDQFTYKAITGLRKVNIRKEQTTWFGLMHLIYEVQLLAAKVFSSTVEMLVRSNKGGGFIEESALLDYRDFQDEVNKPGKWHVVTDGGTQKIREMQGVRFPPFHGELLSMTQGLVQQMTGVSGYLQGTATNERSNVYVSNLQSRSLIALGPLTDPYQSFRLEMGRLMSESIRLYISDNLIDKVINDDGVEGITIQTQVNPQTGQEEVIPLSTPSEILRSRDLTDFDIAVDTGSASPTEKQAVWNTWGQVGPDLARNMPSIYQEILPGLIKYLPIPSEMAGEISRKVQDQIDQQKTLQTVDGIAEWATQQPMEELEMLMETLGGVLSQYQQQQGQGQGAPPEQQGGPPAQ